jgi:hypothetical protein
MFTRLESLLEDIDGLALREHAVPGFVSSFSAERFPTEVGRGLIMLATGRMPSPFDTVGSNTKVSELRQKAARLVIARVFLSRDSNLYLVLGAAPDCPSEILRENYRRLMGLVHPDTRPVGFPEDSASRVNFAYSVVSDQVRRESYDASLALLKQQNAFPSQAVMEVVSPRQTPPRREESLIERIRATLPKLRFGNGLLAIAALFLVSTAIALFTMTEREADPQIVEARRKPNMAAQVASKPDEPDRSAAIASPQPSSSSSNSTAPAPTTSFVSAAIPTTAAVSPFKPSPAVEISSVQPMTPNKASIKAPPVLVATAPPERQSFVSPIAPARTIPGAGMHVKTETAPPPRPVTRASNLVAPDAASTNGQSLAPVSSGASANVDLPAREVNVDRAVNAATVRLGSMTIAAAMPPAPSEPRVSPADAGDVLVTLSSAYESGSMAAFSKVFAPTMAGRRKVLSDYERVFQQTRQRSIRFSDFKHKINGERLLTSGYAVVSTVDNDNRASSQRIYLEIDISRTPDGLKIERLHNFPMN